MISVEQIKELHKLLDEETLIKSDIWSFGYNAGIKASRKIIEAWLIEVINEEEKQ
jgi:hypothetical protein